MKTKFRKVKVDGNGISSKGEKYMIDADLYVHCEPNEDKTPHENFFIVCNTDRTKKGYINIMSIRFDSEQELALYLSLPAEHE